MNEPHNRPSGDRAGHDTSGRRAVRMRPWAIHRAAPRSTIAQSRGAGPHATWTTRQPTSTLTRSAQRSTGRGPRRGHRSRCTWNTSFESLHLWLASQPRPYGIFTIDRQHTAGLLDPQDRFFCPTLLTGTSLAVRRHDEQTWQCGAHGFGPDAAALTYDLVDLLTAWAQRHRTGPAITVHPASAPCRAQTRASCGRIRDGRANGRCSSRSRRPSARTSTPTARCGSPSRWTSSSRSHWDNLLPGRTRCPDYR